VLNPSIYFVSFKYPILYRPARSTIFTDYQKLC